LLHEAGYVQNRRVDEAMQSGMVEFYEATAEPLTRQCVSTAFAMVGGVRSGTSVLDVAAGPGGLSVAAAEAGARVRATDLSPAMVARLSQRLGPYANCTAQVMDGQALDVQDGAFDAVFSMFGVVNLPDWRQGLRELARATRAGGHGCISTWTDPRGVGPVPILVEALRTTFPEVALFPPDGEGVTLLRSPAVLQTAMGAVGFEDVEVREVEVIWTGPSLEAFVADRDRLYGFMPGYAALTPADRDRLAPALRRAAQNRGPDGSVRVVSTALVAAGRRVPLCAGGDSPLGL
jgi:SAM-dependent methyltransferase